MNAEELQVGDWVINTYYQKAYQVAIIDAVADECSLIIANYATPVKMDYIEPVQITPEILEKNGFTLEYDGYVLNFNGSSQDYLQVQFKHNGDVRHVEGEVFNQCSFNTRMIKYVHELQHALKLCGIDKEIIIE